MVLRYTRRMRRRDFVKLSGTAGATLAALPLVGRASQAGARPDSAAAGTAPRPNIVFILCDDLGFGDVGAFYQNQRAALHDRAVPFFSTPNIDTLARDGVKLTQHYSAAPVCAPSRASLLSGLTQGNANVRDNQFDKALADSHTLGTVLKQAGYATAAFGKWGLQGGDWESRDNKNPSIEAPASQKAAEYQTWTAFPTQRGFDYFFGYVRHVDGHFHYPKEDGREVWQNDREISDDLDKCYTADLWTAQTKKWITEHTAARPTQPFFVYLAYDTPHAKLQNPPCPYPAGGGLKGGVQWTGKPHAMLNTATGSNDGYMFPDYAKGTWDADRNPATPEVPWPDVQQRYANDVRRIDFGVGDVLQLLKDLNIENNTLVIFTSDNGPSIESLLDNEPYEPTFFRGYGPFDGIKRDTWEGGMREPTLARWPAKIPAGRINNQPSGHWDWLATFAEAAGVPVPAACDGVSLMAALTGRGVQRPGTIYIEYFQNQNTPNFADFAPTHRGRKRGQMQNIYLDGYMGVRYNVRSADDDFEIYNLGKDPQEAHDLARSPELASLQTAMKARVLQLRVPNASTPRPYDKALVPPVKKTPTGTPGLTWSLFKGQWPWLPDFRTLSPATRGAAKTFDLAMAASGQPFGVVFEGYFYAAHDGEYAFTLVNDTGAMLFLHDIRVIGEPLRNSAGTFTGNVRLKAGWHPMRIYYRHAGSAKPRLELTCQSEGAEYKVVPDVLRPMGAKG
jgi:arylsulfatase A-like enzyme